MDKRLPWTLRKRKGASGLAMPSKPNVSNLLPRQTDAGSGQTRQASRDARRARKKHKQQRAPAGTSFPPEVVLLCAQRLPPNEVSCTLRAVCRSARDTLAPDPRHCTAQLSQPLPPHVAAWSPAALHGAVTALQQLSFVRKLCLPALAATSGCTTNLEVAWRLVSPCLCPQLPLRLYTSQLPERADAGVAAARMGRSDLVVWLVERRCPLVPARVARAAAVHCSLAGLREVWGALLRLDPGLGAEAEACWQEVTKVADGEAEAEAGEAGVRGGGGGGRGGVPCRDVQEKGAWLFAQHEWHQQQQQRRQRRKGQAVHDMQQQAAAAAALPIPAHVPSVWQWSRGWRLPWGGPGPRCSCCCAPPGQESPPDPNGTTTSDRLYHAAWQGDVGRVRGFLLHLGVLQQQGQQHQEQGQQPAADGEGQQQEQQQQQGQGHAGQQEQQQQPEEGKGLKKEPAVKREEEPEGEPEDEPEEGQGEGQQQQRGMSAWEADMAFDRALQSGSIEAARTMLQAGYRPGVHCYRVAASFGHLHCLKWLLLEARPCPIGRCRDFLSLLAYWPVATTAEQEREAMEVLRLLVEAGCAERGDALLDAAARRGSLPLLMEALRLVPPSKFVWYGWRNGGGGGGGDGGGCGGGGMGSQPRMAVPLLLPLAAGGCEAALELCVRGLSTQIRPHLRGWCYNAWMQAAWRGNMATLECLRRLNVPWESGGIMDHLTACGPWGYVPIWHAPLTVPVLRWAVEEAGCWELGAGACRQLASCAELCLKKARDGAVQWGQAGAAGCGCEGGGVRGEWGPDLWPGWGVYKRAMEAVVEWLMKRAKRLDREERLAP